MSIQDIISFLKEVIPYEYIPNEFATSSPRTVASVKLTGGTPDKYIRGMKHFSFQIIVRSAHPQEAETAAITLFNELNGKEHFKIGAIDIAFCIADQNVPIYIGRDESNLPMYSLNFSCKAKE